MSAKKVLNKLIHNILIKQEQATEQFIILTPGIFFSASLGESNYVLFLDNYILNLFLDTFKCEDFHIFISMLPLENTSKSLQHLLSTSFLYNSLRIAMNFVKEHVVNELQI